MANATRGRVVALDPQQRTITLELGDGRQVTLPRAYLDERPAWWLRGNPDRRTLDLAYATTGHKAQGLTVERALVRVTGAEDGNRLHVQTSRAKRETMLYAVVGPEPRDVELDEPHPRHGPLTSSSPRGCAGTVPSGWRPIRPPGWICGS